jgi:geranylgeranylglycerol-phosphate geranylgeranyltransferase
MLARTWPRLPRLQPLALLELVRAHSALGGALAVWVGARVAGASWEPWWLVPMAVAFLLCAAGNAFNDAADIASDRINRPSRPIPRGAVTPATARLLSFGCACAALVLALPFGAVSTAGTIAGIALLFLYTTHLKAIPLLGNATVALLTAMAMGYGGVLAGDVPAVLLPAASLGLLFGARELLKVIHDLPGDRATSIRTLATAVGPRAALGAATACFVLATGLLALWAAGYPRGWVAPALIALAGLAVLYPLWRNPEGTHEAGRALRWSKGVGLALLAAFGIIGT